MGPVAERLQADATALRKKVATLKIEPARIANGAVSLLDEVSVSKITGEEDRYSHTDLSDFAANVAGAKVAFESVRASAPLDVQSAGGRHREAFRSI